MSVGWGSRYTTWDGRGGGRQTCKSGEFITSTNRREAHHVYKQEGGPG